MRLFFLFYSLVATALGGTGIVVALVMGWPGWEPLVAAGGVGLALAVPASWIIARRVAAL